MSSASASFPKTFAESLSGALSNPFLPEASGPESVLAKLERKLERKSFEGGVPSPTRPDTDRENQARRMQSRLLSGEKPDRWEGDSMQDEARHFGLKATPGANTASTVSSPQIASLEGHLEDERLVACAQGGDLAAFDSLVSRHTQRLYGLIMHMTGSHDDTDDLMQDVWTKVFRSLSGFRGASRFSTWIHSIAVNMTINFLKRRSRRQALSLDAPLGEDGASTPAETLLVSTQTPSSEASLGELQRMLGEALAKLTPDHRAVVTMFDIQGLAHAEIAKILGVSEGTVRSRLFYAHRQLQGYLGDFHTQTNGI